MTVENNINTKIEKAKRQLEQMIDLNPSIMLLVDHTGSIARANKAILDLLQIDDYSSVLGNSIESLFHCQDKDFVARILEQGTECSIKESVFDIGGTTHTLLFDVIELEGKSDLLALTITDITSVNEMATKKEKKYRMETVQALMGALLHNVNQPLTVIMMRAQLMQLQLDKNQLQPESLTSSLRDIMRLTTDIAALLRQVEMPEDYITEPYGGGVDILDIQRSAAGSELDVMSIGIPKALLLALEAHEHGSLDHANTTADCAVHLARKMDIDEVECDTIKRCALLHDIGKLGIPINILQKPGALNDEEHAIMTNHPQVGHDLLKNFHFLHDEAKASLTHAEWFDGSGYPNGLSGGDIPVRSRLLAVSDAYSALTQKRSYRDAMTQADALKIIKERSGTQFDPEIVNVLLENPPENIAPTDC